MDEHEVVRAFLARGVAVARVWVDGKMVWRACDEATQDAVTTAPRPTGVRALDLG